MALTVFSSNRVETLQSRLAGSLAANPLSDPLASEIVVVPTYAMGRWLNLRIAEQQGIAANILYPQPVRWIWQLAGNLLEDLPPQDPYSADALCWVAFEQLPGLLHQPAFATIRSYLADDEGGIKRWQLAQRIAESLDRYQSYRPRMIRAWDAGEDEHWQALLWRRITAARKLPHRVDTLERVLHTLAQSSRCQCLPERISLFSLSGLPPLYFDLVGGLARRIDINLYLHSPTDHYWADLEGEKRRARKRLDDPAAEDLFEAGNELLASWGRQGQAFQDMLLASDTLESMDVDLYRPPDETTLLGKLQHSIYHLDSLPAGVVNDDSISVHICHSALRECQVLHDQLLDLLSRDGTLNPEDILVMIPDISAYAPYIEAVFRGGPLAFNLSDTALADEHPQVTSFLQLLQLPQSRFSLSEILALLDNESLRRRFDLGLADRDEIGRMLEQARTRWGLDSAHKAELGLPPTPENTWEQAKQRFFAAYALADSDLWHGIAPLQDRNDGDAEVIGRFWRLLERLRRWRGRLARPASAADWQQRLLRMIDEFFSEIDPWESRLQAIRDAVAEIPPLASESLGPALIAELMTSILGSGEQSGRLYSGGVTFCGMRPMRSIPFRVICLLGMNRGDFPRRDPMDDFELISRSPAAGDPSRRIEDRYLMLETLLCARDRLYISYTGRSLKDNSSSQPSVLVRELLDFIDGLDGGDGRLGESLITEHPMQAFSVNNFRDGHSSYSAYWYDVARGLQAEKSAAARTWPETKLAEDRMADRLELDQLQRFLRHPVRYFFQQRLGIYLDLDDRFDDDETFDLDGLDKWRLKQQVAQDSLQRREDSLQRLTASGLVAHGPAAASQVNAVKAEHAQWFEQLHDYGEVDADAIAVEIDLGEFRIGGIVPGYFPGRGLMTFHGGRLNGGVLMHHWVNHLALSAAASWRDGDDGRLLVPDETRVFAPVDPATAASHLGELCRIYVEGRQCPLPLLPKCSFAWAQSEEPSKATARAWAEWRNQRPANADVHDAYLDLVLRGGPPPIDEPRFGKLAERLYRPALDSSGRP